ncbi:MAG: L,D-transpeptidase family protein [Patescibacteria group bacterium]|nr:L,D-transpeptidase family protein [Patescibacteria group bacterium]
MKFWSKIIFISLFIVSLVLSAINFFLWQKIKSFEPIVYYNVPAKKSFIYSQKESIFGIENYLRETIEKEMVKLKKEKEDFVYIDLKEMKLTLYKEGEMVKSFPVKGKGADWFLGKTPPGVYYAGYKSRLQFSSVALVWMPYAIQFYGNYFIHGVPYDRRGRLLISSVSGGCIRLTTQDVTEVFNFTKKGMPILIFDEEDRPPLLALNPTSKELSPPETQAQFLLVADLDTGEIILNKEGHSEFYGGPATNIMLALSAAESINLEKRIFVSGKSYQGYDLLPPLLLYSSKEAALFLSRFRTPEDFVSLMNEKAKAIGMENTFFEDLTGESKENKTTLYDVARMMRYIKDYQKFILDITNQITALGENEKKSTLGVFKMKYLRPPKETNENEDGRNIFVGIANSPDIEKDLKNILEWLERNFSLRYL